MNKLEDFILILLGLFMKICLCQDCAFVIHDSLTCTSLETTPVMVHSDQCTYSSYLKSYFLIDFNSNSYSLFCNSNCSECGIENNNFIVGNCSNFDYNGYSFNVAVYGVNYGKSITAKEYQTSCNNNPFVIHTMKSGGCMLTSIGYYTTLVDLTGPDNSQMVGLGYDCLNISCTECSNYIITEPGVCVYKSSEYFEIIFTSIAYSFYMAIILPAVVAVIVAGFVIIMIAYYIARGRRTGERVPLINEEEEVEREATPYRTTFTNE